MAEIKGLREFCESYGTAVRAGVITPNIEDEIAVRKMFKLPPPPAAVVSEWARTGGVRLPITLSKDLGSFEEETK